MTWQHCVLLALAGAVFALAEVIEENCSELGKRFTQEAKHTLLCDRSGRFVNLNKFCSARLSVSKSGRLIIDTDGPVDPKKQANHFPDLCLPGQKTFVKQNPWLCTCTIGRKGHNRWSCVVAEDGAGGSVSGDAIVESRQKRSAPAQSSTTIEAETEFHNSSLSMSATSTLSASSHFGRMGSSSSGRLTATPTPAASTSEEATHDLVNGRMAATTPYKPNVMIDYCDESGFLHTLTSRLTECSLEQDVNTPTSTKEASDIHVHNVILTPTYDCLPGTYMMRCEVCAADSRCQRTACP